MRGMAESRASTVVLGWDGRRNGRGTVFGPTLDRLLDCTEQLVVVTRCCADPLNTTRRIVLVLPPRSHRSHGFYEALRNVKRMASRLGAPMLVLVVGEPLEPYEERFGMVRPQVEMEFRGAGGWDEALSNLKAELRGGDLLVVLSARRGAVEWHRELDALPARLAGNFSVNTAILYPAEVERPPLHERRRQSPLPRTLTQNRIVFDLPRTRLEPALESLLSTEFGSQTDRMSELQQALQAPGSLTVVELVRGVVFASARAEGLREPLIFLGISPEGVDVPEVSDPAQLLFLQISPRDAPEQHLENLAAVAEAVCDPRRARELSSCRTPEDLFSWFRVQQEAGQGGEGAQTTV